MPVLDAEGVVADSVAAILGQDYPGRLEVVIASGPSSDRTAVVLQGLAADPRVRVVDNPSGGTAAGLNAAIAAASGQVIARCDAQSRFPPGYLRRAAELLEETGADNVGGIQAAEGAGWKQRAVAIAQSTPLGVGDARYRTGGRPGPVESRKRVHGSCGQDRLHQDGARFRRLPAPRRVDGPVPGQGNGPGPRQQRRLSHGPL